MWKVARRPRWIAALILALAVAAGFALLSQWQLARSVSTGTVVDRSTETTLPLETVARPQSPVTTASDGQLVTVSGSFVAGDYLVLSKRLNGGVDGFWVVGHFRTEDGAGVAVALGWTASKAEATSAADGLSDEAVEVSGRYVADEAPQETDFEHGEFSTLSMAALVNLWPDADPAGVYNGYIVSSVPVAGLTARSWARSRTGGSFVRGVSSPPAISASIADAIVDAPLPCSISCDRAGVIFVL